MGAVYLGEDLSLGRKVAVKIISQRIAESSEVKARFQREAKTLATLDHPNIVHVYAFGQTDAGAYLVMEYVDGETLSSCIQREGAMSVARALEIATGIVRALDGAWECGVVHRDIKPANVLIDRRGRVKVVDFGLAKPVSVSAAGQDTEDSLTQTGYILGSPHYLSPEQAQGKPVDFRADIYSVGLILYEMLTGTRAFTGTTPIAVIAKHLHEQLVPVEKLRPDVPAAMATLIERMTAKDPMTRPDSYADVLHTLANVTPASIADDATVRQLVAASRAESSRPPKVVWAAAAFVAIALTVGGFLIWREKRHTQAEVTAPTGGQMVIAVAPLYGPDSESDREGRVMAALIEKEISGRLRSNVKVVGLSLIDKPVRSHDEARTLGKKFGADVVIWGEAFALRRETEIQPFVTIIEKQKPVVAEAETREAKPDVAEIMGGRPPAGEQSMSVVRVGAEARNQLEMHRTSAAGVGDLVLKLAGMHALYNENKPTDAVRLLKGAPKTADTLRLLAEAQLRLRRALPQFPPPYAGNGDYWRTKAEKEVAVDRELIVGVLTALDEAIQLEPRDAQTHATRGDVLWELGDFAKAVEGYRSAAANGSAYITRNARLFGGRLWVPDAFRHESMTRGSLERTAYLLGLDPATFRVTDRRRLPGIAHSFRENGEWLEITYEPAGKERTIATAVIRFDGERFDRPVYYGSNLLVRVRSMKSGWIAIDNLMDDFDFAYAEPPVVAHLRLGQSISPDSPTTLQQAEAMLRKTSDVDPTQPWYPIQLGMVLWEQGRKQEAEGIWTETFSRSYPGVPYYEYAWVTSAFVRMKLDVWADRAWQVTMAKRQAYGHPIGVTTFIERVINAPFVRAAALQGRLNAMNPEDRHRWLERARQLGTVHEADEFLATLWARHFESAGLDKKAAQERALAAQLGNLRTNITRTAIAIDFAINVQLAAASSLVILLFSVLLLCPRRQPANVTASRRDTRPATGRAILAKAIGFGARQRLSRGEHVESPGGVARYLRISLFTLLTSASLFAIWRVAIESSGAAAGGASGVLFLIFVMARMLTGGGGIRATISAVSSPARRALLLACVSLSLSGIALVIVLQSVQPVSMLALNSMDSFGSAGAVSNFEDLLRQRDTPARRYAAAVSRHMAGDFDRAHELYASLRGDGRAAANLARVEANNTTPAIPLSIDDAVAATSGGPFNDSLASFRHAAAGDFAYYGTPEALVLGLLAAPLSALLLLGLLLTFAIVPPSGATSPPVGRTRRLMVMLVPAYAAFSRCRWTLGWITLFLFSIPAAFAAYLAGHAWEVIASGPFMELVHSNLHSVFPLPGGVDVGSFSVFTAYPGAWLFVAGVVASFAIGLLLHTTAVALLLRDDGMTTRSTLHLSNPIAPTPA